MSLKAKETAGQETPTEIYLPEFHFPKDQSEVSVSSGKWEIDDEEFNSVKVQCLRWWHEAGKQNIKIEGVKRKLSEASIVPGDDVSYLEQCQKGGCVIM